MTNFFLNNLIMLNPNIVNSLGKKLFLKITEIIQSEVNDITEQDCIDYITQLVIDRTFDGYMTEIKTIYGQLQNILKVPIKSAPDKWDRLYNIDFSIQVGEKYIGLQIKPVNKGIQLPEIFKEYSLQEKTHKKFTKKYGGKVFYIFSSIIDGKKEIQNKEVINEISEEINRLSNFQQE